MVFSRKKTYTPLLRIPGIPYGVNQKEPGFPYGLLRFWVEFLMGSAIFVCGIPHGICFEFIHVKLVPYGVY